MIQTIALEDVSNPILNPRFDPHAPFFDSPRGKEVKEFAKERLQRYQESENFSKIITLRLMIDFKEKLTSNHALILSHPKLGKRPIIGILAGFSLEKGGKTIKVKAKINPC